MPHKDADMLDEVPDTNSTSTNATANGTSVQPSVNSECPAPRTNPAARSNRRTGTTANAATTNGTNGTQPSTTETSSSSMNATTNSTGVQYSGNGEVAARCIAPNERHNRRAARDRNAATTNGTNGTRETGDSTAGSADQNQNEGTGQLSSALLDMRDGGNGSNHDEVGKVLNT